MLPRGGRWWAWAFPVVVGMGALDLAKGATGPAVLALDITCITGGLVGTVLLFEFGRATAGAWALRCENCGRPAPRVRKPANRRQMLWGGWSCRKCGAELDRRGRVVEETRE